MDIYQRKLLARGTMNFVSSQGNEKFEFDDNLSLFQNSNYTIGGYKMSIDNDAIETIVCDEKKVANQKDGSYIIDVDFELKDFELTIKFKNNVAEDCVISVKLVKTDKEKFDQEVSKQNHDALINSLALKITNGVDCINVLWQNSCPSVNKTIVEVYEVIDDIKYLVESCETKGNFKSVPGLSYGNYLCNVKQYDSNKMLIIENEAAAYISDFAKEIKESLKEVKCQVAASGRHVVSL